MLEFLRRLFAPEPRSSETAKERLRLVLLSDHLSLAPEVIEALKSDLLAVISRYLEIDAAQADVTFEQREREVAMLASIPIMGVRERPGVAENVAAGAPQAPLVPPEPRLAAAPLLPLGQPAETHSAAVETQAAPAPEAEPPTIASEAERPATAPEAELPATAPEAELAAAAPGAELPVAPPGAEVPVTAVIEASLALALTEQSVRTGQATSSSARRRRRKKAAAAKRSPQGHATPGFGPA